MDLKPERPAFAVLLTPRQNTQKLTYLQRKTNRVLNGEASSSVIYSAFVTDLRQLECWDPTSVPGTRISSANGTRALTVHGWATVKLYTAVALLPISTVAPVETSTLDPPSGEKISSA
ncbi:hypothetical protein CDAR_432831 [Caerostris darwini]|uniref:Uncharacterized protein n=1 Tax=Caerostris darwini TaxID=1538125 RepID=A0AAV4QKE3_9ARAC|nr:hypothetical protein CDAR_432831 [Caerostris darwini]